MPTSADSCLNGNKDLVPYATLCPVRNMDNSMLITSGKRFTNS